MSLPVELIASGKKFRAITQDLSPLGMFVRLSPPLPVGTVVQIVISPNGQRLVTTGQVTHALGEVEASTIGRFPGVGIQIQNDDDGSLKVVSPLEDSPAYKAGIKAGDIIAKINGKSAKGISLNQAVKTITGTSRRRNTSYTCTTFG